MRVQFGNLTLDSASRQLVRGGDAIHLSPKAFDLLCHLLERRPSAVSKDQLFELVDGDVLVERTDGAGDRGGARLATTRTRRASFVRYTSTATRSVARRRRSRRVRRRVMRYACGCCGMTACCRSPRART